MSCPPHAHCTYRCGDDCDIPEGQMRICFLHDCDEPLPEWVSDNHYAAGHQCTTACALFLCAPSQPRLDDVYEEFLRNG